MNRLKHLGAVLAVALAAAMSTPACAATSVPGPDHSPEPAVQGAPTLTAAATKGRATRPSISQQGGRKTPVTLPAGWPKDVALPPGSQLIGGTASPPDRWTVLVVQAGSAAAVLRSANAFYRSAGYRAVTGAVLIRPHRRITLVASNRDHSATTTNLVIEVVIT